MLNPIKEIAKWQKDAGNTAKPYDDFLESSFQIEEALEGFGNLREVAMVLNKEFFNICPTDSPKDISRAIVMTAQAEVYDENGESTGEPETLSDVDRLDKACDAIVFAIGSMTKLGLDHHAITKALIIVNEANKAKLNCNRDAEGKLLKPEGFVGPEVKLQELLDSIRK